MAEVKKLKKTTGRSTANRTTAQKTENKPGMRARKTAAEKSELDKVYEALDLSGPDGQDTDSFQQLCTYVNRAIGKRSEQIARKLTRRVEEGNLASSKFMMELVSKKKPGRKASANGFLKLVRSLENEPECVKPDTQ